MGDDYAGYGERSSLTRSGPQRSYSACRSSKKFSQFVEHHVQHGDTLQGIALKYDVTVSVFRVFAPALLMMAIFFLSRSFFRSIISKQQHSHDNVRVEAQCCGLKPDASLSLPPTTRQIEPIEGFDPPRVLSLVTNLSKIDSP